MATQANDRSPDGNAIAPSHRQILYAVSGLVLGMFLSAMDQTIVSTSIRTITDDLHSYSQQAWVITAYLVTSTIVTPLYGRLSDFFGRKPCYLVAIAVFLAGSAACAFSASMFQLALFRGIQGVGAGGLMSLPFTILGDLVAPRERARYQGYFLAVFTCSSVLGPVVGGFFATSDHLLGITGWRWIFLVNLPVGCSALVIVHRVLHVIHVRRDGVRIDWLGGSMLAVGIVPLLTVATQGHAWGWASPRSVVCYAMCVAGLLVFVRTERRMGEHAFMPLRTFRNRQFAQGAVLSFIVGAVMMGGLSLLPQYFQVVRGAGPTEGGLLALPAVLGVTGGALVSGRIISRTGRYRVQSLAGAALCVLTLFVLHDISADSDLVGLLGVTLLLGVGIGAFNQPLTLVMQNILPARDLGVSTAAVTFFRQIGGTLGVAVLLSLWFVSIPPAITSEVNAASQRPAFQQSVDHIRVGHRNDRETQQLVAGLRGGNSAAVDAVANNTAVLQRLPGAVERPLIRAFADAMRPVFLSACGLSLAGLVLLTSWKPVTLRATAGLRDMAKEGSSATRE